MEAMKKRLRELTNIMNERIEFYCLTQTGLESYVKVMQHRFQKHISSQQAQKEADRVYAGVQKVLYGNGKFVHLKKLDDQRSISQKCSTNGIKVHERHQGEYGRQYRELAWINHPISHE